MCRKLIYSVAYPFLSREMLLAYKSCMWLRQRHIQWR